MMRDATLSIGRSIGEITEVKIEIDLEHRPAIEVRMGLEDFAQALLGIGAQSCRLRLRGAMKEKT